MAKAREKIAIFDLDGVLYPPSHPLFIRVTAVMANRFARLTGLAPEMYGQLKEAYSHRLDEELKFRYGFGVDQLLHNYHEEVDYGQLEACARTRSLIEQVSGRRVILTDGSMIHARHVLEARGLDNGLFDDIYSCMELFGDVKRNVPFEDYLHHIGCEPGDIRFFADDLHVNLRSAHGLGIKTVWVDGGADVAPPHVTEKHPDLFTWLEKERKRLSAGVAGL